jgi:hypothetical protein
MSALSAAILLSPLRVAVLVVGILWIFLSGWLAGVARFVLGSRGFEGVA